MKGEKIMDKKTAILAQFEKSLNYILDNVTQDNTHLTCEYCLTLWGENFEKTERKIKLGFEHQSLQT